MTDEATPPAAADAPPAAPPVADARVEADTPCAVCGYSLRSLAVDGVCPECAAPVARTLRGNLLRYSEARYVGRLASGTGLVMIGSALLTLALVVLSFGEHATDEAIVTVGVACLLIAIPVWACGWRRVVAREPGVRAERRRWISAALRVLLLPLLIGWLLGLVTAVLGEIGVITDRMINMGVTISILLTLPTLVAAGVLGLTRVVELARRLPDRRLERRARIFRLVAPLTLISSVAFVPMFMFLPVVPAVVIAGFAAAWLWLCFRLGRLLRAEALLAGRGQ